MLIQLWWQIRGLIYLDTVGRVWKVLEVLPFEAMEALSRDVYFSYMQGISVEN